MSKARWRDSSDDEGVAESRGAGGGAGGNGGGGGDVGIAASLNAHWDWHKRTFISISSVRYEQVQLCGNPAKRNRSRGGPMTAIRIPKARPSGKFRPYVHGTRVVGKPLGAE
jgi:hypothetical protein